jgi:hypothetical protein
MSVPNTTDTLLSPEEQYRRTLGGVQHVEVIDFAIRFQRLRCVRPFSTLLSTAGWLLVGAGAGALVQDGKVTTRVWLSVLPGAALLLGALLGRQERSENLHNLCEDFLRFVDRWPTMFADYATNSAYVRAEAATDSSLARIKEVLRRANITRSA